jgi:hypothetical protein
VRWTSIWITFAQFPFDPLCSLRSRK